MNLRNLIVFPVVAILTACASEGSPRLNDRPIHDRYMDYAGAPITSVNNLTRFDGWHAVGRDKLILWGGLNEAYLLTLESSCLNLDTANRIALTSSVGATVQVGFDYVRYRDFTGRRERCRITEIRPVDYKRMQADIKAAKQH